MSLVISCYAAICGGLMGSYLHVAATRVPLRLSFWGRSRCEGCRRVLGPSELIPIVSYVIQSGKCKHCRMPLSISYPLIEIASAGLYLLAWLLIGLRLELVVSILLIAMLLLVSMTDYSRMMIPNMVLLFFAIPLVFLRLCVVPVPFSWLSAISTAMMLLILVAACLNGSMGGGDLKLFVVLAIVLGPKLFLPMVACAACLALLFVGAKTVVGKFAPNTAIPFAPFISAAALLVYFAAGI